MFLRIMPFLCILSSPSLWAYENLPEYKIGIEQDTIYSYLLFVDESFHSDKQTFARDWASEYRLLNSSRILQLGYGSLNVESFDVQNRLKIQQAVGENSELHFWYIEDRDYESSAQYLVLDFNFALNPTTHLSLYAIPSVTKAEVDIGLALQFQVAPKHYLRVFGTFIDLIDTVVDRVDTDSKISGVPMVAGVVGRVFEQSESQEGSYFEYVLKGEKKYGTFFSFPNREWRGLAQVGGQIALTAQHSLGLQLAFTRHNKRQGSLLSETSQDHFFARLEHEDRLFFQKPNWFFSWGFLGSYRKAIVSDLGPIRRKDLIPYLWWGFRLAEDKRLQLGVDYTRFSLDGYQVLGDRLLRTARVNFKYDVFYLNHRSRLGLLASFSLPLDTRVQWMGGRVSYELSF